MGCNSSKVEEIDAVVLCRERSNLLAEVIRLRYALADAHAAYANSLRSVGVALHRVFGAGENLETLPLISLPAQRKGDLLLARSHSGSHIEFLSSDEFDSDGNSLQEEKFFNVDYARGNPPAHSVSFEEVRDGFVDGQVSSSLKSCNFLYGDEVGFNGCIGSSSSMDEMYRFSSKDGIFRAVPPPPSPPRMSALEFLNPFENFENLYWSYGAKGRILEVREDEGIPDLEEYGEEVIKFVASHSAPAPAPAPALPEYSSKGASVSEDVGSSVNSSGMKVREMEEEVELVEKNVVGGEMQKLYEEKRNLGVSRKYHDVSEVLTEVRVQFERAADSIEEMGRLLEVGKLHYIRKKSVFAASLRMMCGIPLFMVKDEDFVCAEDKVVSTRNLSSTLQKLYIWEQKLHNEVRVEEKMRLLHDRNSKKLKHLDQRGAEAHKIDATQTFVRKLSTKIKIAIQIVNSITTKINVLRDEEFWPHIDRLIEGFEKMWGIMFECHQIQSLAIAEANNLDSIASSGKFSDEHMNALMQLEMELLRWTRSFSALINSQKNFVKTLNRWLVLCLQYQPEKTADGIPPYSPASIGAPPVFIIFNCLSQALDMVPEKEILEAMLSSVVSIRQLWQHNDIELRRKTIYDRDMARLIKMREREKRVISKEVESLIISSNQFTETRGLESSLRHLFQSMENFARNSMKAYGDIHGRAEEEKASIERTKGC